MGERFSLLFLAIVLASALQSSAEARTFSSSSDCREYYNSLKAREPVVRARIKSVHNGAAWTPEYTEWRSHLTELESILGTCSAMEGDERENKKKAEEGETTAKEDVERVNEVHEKLSDAVLRSTVNSTIRGIQKKTLDVARDQMGESAGRLDDALWSLKEADFGATKKEDAAPGVWTLRGGASTSTQVPAIGENSAASFSQRMDEYNAPRLAAEAAARERAAAEARHRAAEEALRRQVELARLSAAAQAAASGPRRSSSEKLMDECRSDGGQVVTGTGRDGRRRWFCSLTSPKWSNTDLPM